MSKDVHIVPIAMLRVAANGSTVIITKLSVSICKQSPPKWPVMPNTTHHWCCYCCSPPRSGCSCPCSSWSTNHSKPGVWLGPSPLGSVTTWCSQRCCHRCLVSCWNLCPNSVAWSGPDGLDLAMTAVECSPPRHRQTSFQTPPIRHRPAATSMLASQVPHSQYIMYRQHTHTTQKAGGLHTYHACLPLSDLPGHDHYTWEGTAICSSYRKRTYSPALLGSWAAGNTARAETWQNNPWTTVCLKHEVHSNNC